MWDERDTTARWVQGICAVFLFVFAVADGYWVVTNFGMLWVVTGIVLFVGAVKLCWRCAVYAVTGRRCVNLDEY